MIEHWYDYLPAAWLTPEGRWYVILSLLLLMAVSFAAGVIVGRRKKIYKENLIAYKEAQLDAMKILFELELTPEGWERMEQYASRLTAEIKKLKREL